MLLDGRRSLAVARLGRADHARRAEVRHGDGGRIAPLGRAVLVKDCELVADPVDVAQEIARVGVPGDQSQRALLAGAADEDRNALLQWARVTGRLLNHDRPPLEARGARPPHQRQELKRVLEPVGALAERRELPPVQPVLALEPGRPEPAHRAPTGHDVEGRDHFRQVSDVPVGDPGDERAQPDPLGHAGEVAERRVALEHVLPLAPHLRDLDEVVHHPEAREAGLLGRPRDLG